MTPRRTFLKSIAATLAVPAFPSLQAAAAAAKTAAPTRMAFIYLPHGVNLDLWRPQGSGKDYTLSKTLEPLAELREHFSVLRGLDHDKAFANGDGAGDHARANATSLPVTAARLPAANLSGVRGMPLEIAILLMLSQSAEARDRNKEKR